MLFFMICSQAQITGTWIEFCNIKNSSDGQVSINREALRACDFTLRTVPDYEVAGFKMTVFSKAGETIRQGEVSGSEMPAAERHYVINGSNKILFEFIKLKAPDNTIRSVKPLSVIIQD